MAGDELGILLGSPDKVRVTPDGKRWSLIDIIMIVSFTDDDGNLTPNARTNARTYLNRLCSDHPELDLLRETFKFKGRGQQETPVASRGGILQIMQLLRGKKAAKYRERTAVFVEKYIDADMELADDITDRAWASRVAESEAEAEHHKWEDLLVRGLGLPVTLVG